MWNNQPVSRKLTIAFGSIILVSLLVYGVVAYVLGQVRQAAQWNEHTYKVIAQLENVVGGMVNQETGLRGYLVGGTENFLEPFNGGKKQTAAALDEVASLTSDNPVQQRRIGDLRGMVADWQQKHAEPTIALQRESKKLEDARAREASGAGKQYMDAIRAKIGEMESEEAGLLKVRSERAETMSALANESLIVGGAVSLAIAVFVGWLFGNSVTAPVGRITAAMVKVASGEDAQVEHMDRKDEVGALGKAALSFAEAMRKIRAEAAASVDRDTIERERKEREAQKAKEMAEDQAAFEELGKGMHALSSGNLTFRIETEFPVKSRQLKADFNAAIEKLQQSLTVVATNTSTIRSSTGEISVAADDLSRRTEQQAVGLEQTAASLGTITNTIRKTSEGASHANDVVSTAKSEAEQSGEVVNRAVEAMTKIEKSSGEIANIITVIDEIAFQTNLLALNAGVEAARAGEAGRGFAVVASEVRALAQRSAEAAKEIKTLILASNEQVNQGVDLVAKTGQALNRIVAQVNEISGIVVAIADSAREQAAGIEQINQTFGQMDQLTQQNAAMVEESTGATHALSRETDELARLVGQFRLGADVGSFESSSAPAPRARATRAASHASQPVVAMKTTGRGGAARKPDASPDKSWNEF